MSVKLKWQGVITAVQPRIHLLRSFDQRNHNYLGYLLRVNGVIDGEARTFTVGIGKAVQAKHEFRAGDEIQGECLPVADTRKEAVEFYKVSKLKVLKRAPEIETAPPPWLGPPPALEIYRHRGHRRLAARTYSSKCTSCIWGCRMLVEITVDHWNPGQKRYRFETFCYGPKSCPRYKAGPSRKVPGRRGMVFGEQDWID